LLRVDLIRQGCRYRRAGKASRRTSPSTSPVPSGACRRSTSRARPSRPHRLHRRAGRHWPAPATASCPARRSWWTIGTRPVAARIAMADEALGLCKLAVDGSGSWPLPSGGPLPHEGDPVFAAGVSAAGDVTLAEGTVRGVVPDGARRLVDTSFPAQQGIGGRPCSMPRAGSWPWPSRHSPRRGTARGTPGWLGYRSRGRRLRRPSPLKPRPGPAEGP